LLFGGKLPTLLKGVGDLVLIRWYIEVFLFLLAGGVITYGMISALGMWIMARPRTLAMRLLALCLILLCSTIGHEALLLGGGYDKFPSLRFLPVCLSLAVGPVFFHYVKARLYPAFRLRRKDIKHFLPAIGQVSAYVALWVQPVALQDDLWNGFYRYYLHPIENLLFVITGLAYLYFAYRFVKHEIGVRHKDEGLLVALRLKRTTKVLALFLAFYAGYLIDDTVRRLLLLRAQTDMTWLSYLSFAALLGMLVWLSLFAWLNEFWWPRRHRLSVRRLLGGSFSHERDH